MPDVTFACTKTMKVHCVYIPDVIVSIFPDVTLDSTTNVKVHCDHFPNAILSIFLMLLFLQKALEVHCVYIPDVILPICRMPFMFQKGSKRALSLYSGCRSLYIPVVILFKQMQ